MSENVRLRLEARDKVVLEKFKAGGTVREIAIDTFTSESNVKRILKSKGVEVPRKKRKDFNKSHTPKQKKVQVCGIVGAESIADLEKIINDRLKDGYSLQGTFVVQGRRNSDNEVKPFYWQTFIK